MKACNTLKTAMFMVACVVTVTSAQAHTAENGIGFNGIGFNSLGINGIGFNSLGINGIGFNSLGINGARWNGLDGNTMKLVKDQPALATQLGLLADQPLF